MPSCPQCWASLVSTGTEPAKVCTNCGAKIDNGAVPSSAVVSPSFDSFVQKTDLGPVTTAIGVQVAPVEVYGAQVETPVVSGWLPNVTSTVQPDGSEPSLTFTISGWTGYNARFNGEYKSTGSEKYGRMVFTHLPKVGVGAGHDWCRMWWSDGEWRIGHMSWVRGDERRCCAAVRSEARHPSEIRQGEWKEHKGQGANMDHGYPESFKKASGNIKVNSNATLAQPADVKLGATPSHGNPASNSALNTELNNVARNTNDTNKARRLVASGADLSSTNGPQWRHTPLHQAAYHGRYEMAKCLVELGAPLNLHSNPCGRGSTGIPLELARGGGHKKIAKMLEEAMSEGKKDSGLFGSQSNHLNKGRTVSNSFDTSGILYALGCENGRYASPLDSGKVSVQFSADGGNYYSKKTGHRVGDHGQAAAVIIAHEHRGDNATQWSKGQSGAHFTVNLKGTGVLLTEYVYRGDSGGGNNHPRSWDLQGSNDGKTWDTLSEHREDYTITMTSSGRFTIPPTSTPYSMFRIQNRGSPNHLCCSGIEFYGEIIAPSAPSAPIVVAEAVYATPVAVNLNSKGQMFCTSCGAGPFQQGANFCAKCGTQL